MITDGCLPWNGRCAIIRGAKKKRQDTTDVRETSAIAGFSTRLLLCVDNGLRLGPLASSLRAAAGDGAHRTELVRHTSIASSGYTLYRHLRQPLPT